MIRSGGGNARVSSAAERRLRQSPPGPARDRRGRQPRARHEPSLRARRKRAPGRGSSPGSRASPPSRPPAARARTPAAAPRRRWSSAGCRAPPTPRTRRAEPAQKPHQLRDLGRRPLPVLLRERVQGQDRDANLARAAHDAAYGLGAWRCPSLRPPPRASAQRPLPSMMIATCWEGDSCRLPSIKHRLRGRRAGISANGREARRTVARRGDRWRENAHDGGACASRRARPNRQSSAARCARCSTRAACPDRAAVGVAGRRAGNYSCDPLAIPLGIVMCLAFVIARAGVVAGAVSRSLRPAATAASA